MTILAWHFVGKTLRDGRPIPKDGEWLEHDGPLIMCQSGLHASRHPFDALQYAPGAILCYVDCDGQIIEGDDKLDCSRRRIIQRHDVTEGLRYFARMQALSVIHLWEPPDIVLEYLMTGNRSLRSAARSAAWSAVGSAAWSAARSTAESAAWSAARSAAWSAVGSAVGSAAWSTAWSAVGSAAKSEWANLVYEGFGIKENQ